MKWFTCLMVFINVTVFCQERVPLKGKITAGKFIVTDVFVINKGTGAEAKSNAKGLFTITAKVGDKLAVYSNKIEVREFAVTKLSFAEVPYVMEVIPKGTELKEVVINAVTPESLGLVPANQKQYTVAERRLRAAGGEFGLGNGFTVSLDYIINVISGRLKMLEKALETEKKEFAIERLNGIYLDEQIEVELKIPKEYVRGFLFYVVEDEVFLAAMHAKNQELARLNLIRLSESYRERLAEGAIKPDGTD
jgi:hypothetical protein